MPDSKRPFVLIIRDGWGHNPDPKLNNVNATWLADTPVNDTLVADYPHVLIETSGEDVGLPDGTMGNSEVGHQNIGAGRIVYQESVRITKSIREGDFFRNDVLRSAVRRCRETGGKLHIMGIASDIGVHGLLEHCYACVELAKREGLDRVFLHAFMDGRDSPPDSGKGYLAQLEAKLKEIGVGRLATVCGRFYAMDRDNRWNRVEKAYRMLTRGEGRTAPDGPSAAQHYYDNPTDDSHWGDEFILPTHVTTDGRPRALVADGDAVIFYNYRGDRPREITKALTLDEFDAFDRGKKLDLFYVAMTEWEKGLPVHVAFPKAPKMQNITGEYLATLGLKQFRCAETEKYAHVTFFFNDYREQPFDGEDRKLVASPKVSTYDLKPEMSAPEVTEEAVRAVDSGTYDFVLINFANCDMVGHTGKLDAAIKAVATVDRGVGRIIEAVRRQNGIAIVTADHGNAELMVDPATGTPHTAHTVGKVNLIVVDDRFKGARLREGGRLADVMPTVLRMMGIEVPPEWTGTPLVEE